MLTMDEMRVAAHYRAKATEMRLSAEFEHPEEAAIFISLADGFDRLAERALRRMQESTLQLERGIT